MSGKLTVRCLAWRPLCRNTLRGFATVKIEELRLAFHEVAIHQKNDRAWAQLPSQPWIKDGTLVRGDDGKVRYQPLHEFDNAAIRNAFSDAVVRAVLEFDSRALDCREGVLA
jgi:hypothetical protein